MLARLINWLRNEGHTLPAVCPACKESPRKEPRPATDNPCKDDWHVEKLWERYGILGEMRRAEQRKR